MISLIVGKGIISVFEALMNPFPVYKPWATAHVLQTYIYKYVSVWIRKTARFAVPEL